MASSKETYCLCGQPYNIGQFMIECDCCREWFHGSCVDVKIYQSDDIDKYHCPKCAQTYGPSVFKVPTNNHRQDRYEVGSETRPSQVGSPAWIRALAARPLRPTATSFMRLRGYQFTEDFIKESGFSRPILFNTSEGLEMKTPNPVAFTVRSVLRYCGAQLEVEVIDVRKQATLRMPLGEFVEYIESPTEVRDDKVLNVLSLEVSDTSMSTLIEPPGVARRLDWACTVWNGGVKPPRPAVQKYCLMSAGGSYTDWHVDFGGTTVWYHVLQGRKIFYFVPPTASNLALYQQWNSSNNQNERFFGDMVEWYGTVELNACETLFIPGGWIHAVLTPCDSLVIGGNFLHSYAIEMQLQIYEIERRLETHMTQRYPLFEAMHWYAGAHLLTQLRRINEETQDEDFMLGSAETGVTTQIPALVLRGLRILAAALKEWHALKSTDQAKRDNVPKCLNSSQLVRELGKELRAFEKRTTTAAQKDKDFKLKSGSHKTHSRKQSHAKKSLKLTLPKPIMHMAHNGEFTDDKKDYSIENKDYYMDNKNYIKDNNILQDRYIPQELKFNNGIEQKYFIDNKEMTLGKTYVYDSYGEHIGNYGQDSNGYVERHEKKNGGSVLRIKLNSPSSSRIDPPPYAAPEHSILKSHLIGSVARKSHQWTISKKDISDEFQDEQILFTNDNIPVQGDVPVAVQQDINYGAGMYSAEDIQQVGGYQGYSAPSAEAYFDARSSYQPYAATTIDHVAPNMHTEGQTVYAAVPAQVVPRVPEVMAPAYQQHLPSYDAAIAQQYTAATQPPVAPQPAPTYEPPAQSRAVRRSERAVRRRVSPSFEYEDDLYIDDTPTTTNNSRSNYRQSRAAPVNGIESLIQASELAAEEPDTEDAAVAGMLSISTQRYPAPARTFGLATDSVSTNTSHHDSSTTCSSGNKRKRKCKTLPATSSSADEDMMDGDEDFKEVHRDDEYVYPSLEMSSDEDEEWTSSRRNRSSRTRSDRSRSEKDGPWSPRSRVVRPSPRPRPPPRPHRRDPVHIALNAAKHHTHTHHHHIQNAKRAVIATKSKRPPPPVQTSPTNNKNSRLKKGMKTAKQRLGKILKIHKMMY